MRILAAVLAIFLGALPALADGVNEMKEIKGIKILPPESGVYHCAHPDFGPRDDEVTAERVRAFTELAGRPIVWAFVAYHWDGAAEFPSVQCRVLHEMGVVPLVGIMPWSTMRQVEPEPVYTLASIIAGEHDALIERAALAARELGFPIMMEFGPECNGNWFPWSGAWNGRGEDVWAEAGAPDGPERFREAFRHVVDIFRAAGARDVTWVFHAAARPIPDEPWNSARNYWPGDDYVDWAGFSAYGRLGGGGEAKPFRELIRGVYGGLASLTSRPIAVLEFGVSEPPGTGDKAEWIRAAFAAIAGGEFPRLKAVSWWNKARRADGTPSMLGIDSSPGALAAYRDGAAPLAAEALFSGE